MRGGPVDDDGVVLGGDGSLGRSGLAPGGDPRPVVCQHQLGDDVVFEPCHTHLAVERGLRVCRRADDQRAQLLGFGRERFMLDAMGSGIPNFTELGEADEHPVVVGDQGEECGVSVVGGHGGSVCGSVAGLEPTRCATTGPARHRRWHHNAAPARWRASIKPPSRRNFT